MWRTCMSIGMAAFIYAQGANAQPNSAAESNAFPKPDYPGNMSPSDFSRGIWIVYNNVFVNKAAGLCLGRLRAREIEVYIEDLKWWHNLEAEAITNVTGNETPAGPDFQHHGVYQYSVVLYQPTQTAGERPRAFQLFGTNLTAPTRVALDSRKEICFTVNDKYSGGYDRNAGSYDLHLRVVRP